MLRRTVAVAHTPLLRPSRPLCPLPLCQVIKQFNYHTKMGCSHRTVGNRSTIWATRSLHRPSTQNLLPLFFSDAVPKLCCSDPAQTPLMESKLTAMQFQVSLAESISESLWSSHLRTVTGSHLQHTDGGHLSLELAPVH